MLRLRSSHRTLIQENEYSAALDALVAEDTRYGDVAAGIEWGIATNAECYDLLPDDLGRIGIRVAPSEPFPQVDPLRTFFAIVSDDACALLIIEKVPLDDLI